MTEPSARDVIAGELSTWAFSQSNGESGIHLVDADKLISALASAGFEISRGWRTMESAPKDGRLIDIWATSASGSRGMRAPARWRSEDGWVEDRTGHIAPNATHWRPLPPPPLPER